MPKELELDKLRHGTELVKRGFARMQKGGVVMDVTNAEQAGIAEDAGAVAVMALERVPADIRAAGGVARMASPAKIQEIIDNVSIPVMAKCRIGHFAEAQVLEAIGVDMIDESEVLTPADPFYHVDKSKFTVPFVCGARELGEAVRRIAEGAAMIRTKGEAGTGNVIEAVRHQRLITQMIDRIKTMNRSEVEALARSYASNFGKLEREARLHGSDSETPKNVFVFAGKTLEEWGKFALDVMDEIRKLGRLPVVNFAAGGIATPCDAALMMQLGSDGVFVGSGIFKSDDPKSRAKAIVDAVAHYDDPIAVLEVSRNLGEAMRGIEIGTLKEEDKLQGRGW